MIEVKFLKSASCEPYLLAYNAGHIGHVTPEMFKMLERDGIAERVAQEETVPIKKKKLATKDKIVAKKPGSKIKYKQ